MPLRHHLGPDGHPHLCGRRARGVNSDDHLYVRSAAAWLRDRDLPADFEFVQPVGALIGSVMDIKLPRGGLRVHLDRAVPPAWDHEGREPVLGVPVDRDTLIERWYVHRIRLDSDGTARTVRIGTEAFARETEWFALDDCEMTVRGLSTPAVEQIVRSRSTRPVSQRGAAKASKAPDGRARAQVLLRKLTDAQKRMREARSHTHYAFNVWEARLARSWTLDLSILTDAGVTLQRPPRAGERRGVAAATLGAERRMPRPAPVDEGEIVARIAIE
ncbi:hypothetical protein [Streptomyces sp. NPDC059215]|uniref:hypothetical protein n=1 Tax=Streptomyces sp. NPDC059215 TaxID=3346772 RepID=UPI003693FA7A